VIRNGHAIREAMIPGVLSVSFDEIYAASGGPSIPLEELLRAPQLPVRELLCRVLCRIVGEGRLQTGNSASSATEKLKREITVREFPVCVQSEAG
jgi:hypothetical protein